MPDGVVQGTVELNSEAASYFPGATTSSPTSTTAKADTVQDLVNAGIIVIIAIILAAATLVFILLKRKLPQPLLAPPPQTRQLAARVILQTCELTSLTYSRYA